MIAPTKDGVIALAFGPEPQSIDDWAKIAKASGGRIHRGRNHYETSVEYRIGHVWDDVLEIWMKP